ncbi:hypothetical protein IW140_005574 [Coemansia sp. RSA 1813]|nr:hypothetical protein EV178_005684 [Coemansia sp. RSA 1646]KAJ1765574.1 hypothetical protein LPJ74_006301 [Coemansia sp. RSA 1843]KAJ2086597.1 hypothetical protein IW138_005590 [Coemansia sp. RSA 986]KAJ2211803.1 hypothetical protein EV179_005174 [Coemansia sp. RSA 487]KAJ2564853.1 hypothetical protein IW140_005574 [Coemansia sp. RSA 1813]
MWPFTQKKYEIRGKTVLITGGLGFLSLHLNEHLIDMGAKLVLTDFLSNEEGNQKCQEYNDKAGRRVSAYIRADLSKIDDLEMMMNKASRVFGPLDVLVNNIGMPAYGDFYEDHDSKSVAYNLDVNLRAAIIATRLFVEHVRSSGDRREAAVVSNSSISSMVPNEHFMLYGTSKAALIYFTQANAYLAPQIRVSCVAPFMVDSPMVNRYKKHIETPFYNVHTVVPIENVTAATVKLIESRSSAGQSIISIGDWYTLPVWHFTVSKAYMYILILLSWFVGILKAMVGIRRQPQFDKEKYR